MRQQYSEIVPMLDLAQDLSIDLSVCVNVGEIDFDINEAKVLVNQEGPTDVILRERGEGAFN